MLLVLLGAGTSIYQAAADAPTIGRAASAAQIARRAERRDATFAGRVRAARALDRGASVDPRPVRVLPVDGPLTGMFLEARRSGPHAGVDLDGETGDPVRAAATGVVVQAGASAAPWGGYGIVVLVDHGGGVQTLYAHLSAVTVQVGQAVPAGTVIGAMGSTGHSTGSHLHFEVRMSGKVIDPLAWVASRA